jgi:hypothetical protein
MKILQIFVTKTQDHLFFQRNTLFYVLLHAPQKSRPQDVVLQVFDLFKITNIKDLFNI